GKHRKARMGELERDAREGKIPKGTVIVVEAWDRFSRQPPKVVTDHLEALLKCGLVLGVCQTNKIYTRESLKGFDWVELGLFATLAHQESQRKSDLLKASWRTRRTLAPRAQAAGCQ